MKAQKQNIVVVDDDEGMNQAIRRLLRAAGFEAVAFTSAEALLATGDAVDAGCLVLDVHLPGLSGFELKERLARRGACSPVIFVTAHDDPQCRARAELAGAVAWLTKPFSGTTFVAAVTRALSAPTALLPPAPASCDLPAHGADLPEGTLPVRG